MTERRIGEQGRDTSRPVFHESNRSCLTIRHDGAWVSERKMEWGEVADRGFRHQGSDSSESADEWDRGCCR